MAAFTRQRAAATYAPSSAKEQRSSFPPIIGIAARRTPRRKTRVSGNCGSCPEAALPRALVCGLAGPAADTGVWGASPPQNRWCTVAVGGRCCCRLRRFVRATGCRHRSRTGNRGPRDGLARQGQTPGGALKNGRPVLMAVQVSTQRNPVGPLQSIQRHGSDAGSQRSGSAQQVPGTGGEPGAQLSGGVTRRAHCPPGTGQSLESLHGIGAMHSLDALNDRPTWRREQSFQ
jgi:hypothetical protein